MNLAPQIEQYLPRQVLELISTTSKEAQQLGQRVYLVGGVIRDLLLGYPSFDLDLVVEGEALKLAQQVAKLCQARLVVHPRFGTAKLGYGGFTLDVATARSETYSKPGALPTVTPGTISNDLFRRDFSINAMAVSLTPGYYGELLDPYQGKGDLDSGLIRVLHPNSFTDDPTRILRAIRYEQRLGFKLEPETARLLDGGIVILDAVSGDRLRHELELILREKYPEHAIRRLGELGVLPRTSLPLEDSGWIAEKFSQARQLAKLGNLSSLYLCILIYPLSEDETERFVHRLNIPAKLTRVLCDTLRLKAQLPLLDKSPMRRSDIYYLLRGYAPLAIQANILASESSTICRHLELFLTKLRYVKPHLNGDDLAELGIPRGPQVGDILQELLKARLDGEVKTRAEEERLALLLKPAR